jgi:hypothetical protein
MATKATDSSGIPPTRLSVHSCGEAYLGSRRAVEASMVIDEKKLAGCCDLVANLAFWTKQENRGAAQALTRVRSFGGRQVR